MKLLEIMKTIENSKSFSIILVASSIVLAASGILFMNIKLFYLAYVAAISVPMIFIAYYDIKTRYIQPQLTFLLLVAGLPLAVSNWTYIYLHGSLIGAIIITAIIIGALISYVMITNSGGGDRDIYIVLSLIIPVQVLLILLASLIMGVIGSIGITLTRNWKIPGLTTKERLTTIPVYTAAGKRTMVIWEMPFALPTCIVVITYIVCYISSFITI